MSEEARSERPHVTAIECCRMKASTAALASANQSTSLRLNQG